MSNPLLDFAEKELNIAGLMNKDSDYEGELGNAALEIVKVFSDQGHSGMSASMTTTIVERLLRFEPLTPLTGEDSEWTDVSGIKGKPWYQNKRCPRVFKGEDGRAYDIEGRVFRDPDGSTWTNGESRVYITFPWTPGKPEILDRPAEAA